MAITGLDHTVIAVSDWDAATAFYRDVLGAEAVEVAPGQVCYRFGKTQLNVHGPGVDTGDNVARDPVRPGNSDFCLHWDGAIDDAVTFLHDRGVQVELGPIERNGARGLGRSVYFRDPDGSLLEFISYH